MVTQTRHNLVFLTAGALTKLIEQVNTRLSLSAIEHSKWAIALRQGLIPGIIRRGCAAELAAGIPIGISLPVRVAQQRVRVAAVIAVNEIMHRLTPYQVANLDFDPITASLQVCRQLIDKYSADNLGIWGSNALQIVTGLNYTDHLSDVDMLTNRIDKHNWQQLYRDIQRLEDKYQLRVDIEITLPNGYGINLKEYFNQTKWVLGKSVSDVVLIDKKTLLAA